MKKKGKTEFDEKGGITGNNWQNFDIVTYKRGLWKLF